MSLAIKIDRRRTWRLGLALRAGVALLFWAGMQGVAHPASDGNAGQAENEKPGDALGPPLAGFDIAVLRSAERVQDFRYGLEGLKATPRVDEPRELILSCTLEFGREAGMAEIELKETLIRAVLVDIMGEFKTGELLTVSGKLDLKRRFVEALNRRLKTVQVRRVYFTEFRIEHQLRILR